MALNRHVKHWFRLIAPENKTKCENCKLIDQLIQIDTADEQFPKVELEPIKDLKLPATSDGSLQKCGFCFSYFWHRAWSPGGSEDAFKTEYFESLAPMGFLGVYLELTEALHEAQTYAEQYAEDDVLGEMYREDFAKLKAATMLELEYLAERPEAVIADALVCLKSGAAEKDSKYYRDDILAGEVLAAEAIVHFKNLVPNLSDKARKELTLLADHNNPGVARLFAKI